MRIKIRQKHNCYKINSLKELSEVLDKLKKQKAQYCKMFYSANHYYVLSDKSINSKYNISSSYIVGYLEEYTTLISENAIKDIRRLL